MGSLFLNKQLSLGLGLCPSFDYLIQLYYISIVQEASIFLLYYYRKKKYLPIYYITKTIFPIYCTCTCLCIFYGCVAAFHVSTFILQLLKYFSQVVWVVHIRPNFTVGSRVYDPCNLMVIYFFLKIPMLSLLLTKNSSFLLEKINY